MKGVVEAEERKKGSRREEREKKKKDSVRQREKERETHFKGTSRKRGRITKRLKNFKVNGRTERLDRRSN